MTRIQDLTKKREALLTKGILRELFHYDPYTGILTWIVDRGPVKAGREAGYTRHIGNDNTPYRTVRINGLGYFTHRIAWCYMTGEWPRYLVEHENNDTLDNRMSNLIDTPIRNCKKTNPMRCIRKIGSRNYQVYLHDHMGAQRHIGVFPDVASAVVARDEAEKKRMESCPYTRYGRDVV